MKITWHGDTSFMIQGKSTKVAVDRDFDAHADIHIFSVLDEARTSPDERKVFDWPGEYEAKGVALVGYDGPEVGGKESNVFYFDVDSIKCLHLGKLNADLTEKMKGAIEAVDILFLPVGKDTLEPKIAHQIIDELEPRVIVAMSYQEESELMPFLKEMGIEQYETTAEYAVKDRSHLPDNRTDYIFLKKA